MARLLRDNGYGFDTFLSSTLDSRGYTHTPPFPSEVSDLSTAGLTFRHLEVSMEA
jgi:hypothetical protein